METQILWTNVSILDLFNLEEEPSPHLSKELMATSKFSRFFTQKSSDIKKVDVHRSLSNKGIRSKVDNLSSVRLFQFDEHLECLLRLLQMSGANRSQSPKLLLDDETMQEIRTHYVKLVKQQFKSISTWKSNEHNDSIDSTIALIIDDIVYIQKKLETKTLGIQFESIGGVGGDENKVLPNRNIRQREQYWQFWFWRSDQRYPKWDFGLQKLGRVVKNCSEMKKLLNQLVDIHEVAIPSDYSMFRANIKPKWEDVANKDGGSWIIELERNSTDVALIQSIWLRLLELAFDTSDQHCHPTDQMIDFASARDHIRGLKISMRFKSYQISVWTTNFVDLKSVYQLGMAISAKIESLVHQRLPHLEFYYRAHKISQQNALIKEQTKFGYDHGLII